MAKVEITGTGRQPGSAHSADRRLLAVDIEREFAAVLTYDGQVYPGVGLREDKPLSAAAGHERQEPTCLDVRRDLQRPALEIRAAAVTRLDDMIAQEPGDTLE